MSEIILFFWKITVWKISFWSDVWKYVGGYHVAQGEQRLSLVSHPPPPYLYIVRSIHYHWNVCFMTPKKANKKLLESKTYLENRICSTPITTRSDLSFLKKDIIFLFALIFWWWIFKILKHLFKLYFIIGGTKITKLWSRSGLQNGP